MKPVAQEVCPFAPSSYVLPSVVFKLMPAAGQEGKRTVCKDLCCCSGASMGVLLQPTVS